MRCLAGWQVEVLLGYGTFVLDRGASRQAGPGNRQSPRMKTLTGWRAAGLAFGLGALMALGQAPLGGWFVTLPALAVFLVLVAGQGGVRRSAFVGWFGGAGYFALSLNWIVEPFLIDVARYGWMAPFALILMAFGMAMFWAAAGALAGWSRGPLAAMVVGLGVVELGRGYVLTGFPWALIGHVWIDTPVVQVAALIGPSGLTLITLGMAAGLTRVRWIPVSVVALAAVWAFGVWQLAQPGPPARDVTLRLVQPNAAQGVKWDEGMAQVWFDRLMAATAADPPVDLVIWPETALPYLLEFNPELPAMIAAAGRGAQVAFGVQRVDGEAAYNSMVVLTAGGAVTARYDKHHLVPFGEFLPLGDLLFDWFGLRAFAAKAGQGYTAGPGPVVLDLGPDLGKVLPLICYEAVFPQGLRGAGRADWLLQITNDAWFGDWTGPFQHLAQARLRAIEQGLPLIRVANTGVTAGFDARGRLVADLPFQTDGFVDVALPGALPPSIYAIWGEGPVLLILAGLALVLIRRRGRVAA